MKPAPFRTRDVLTRQEVLNGGGAGLVGGGWVGGGRVSFRSPQGPGFHHALKGVRNAQRTHERISETNTTWVQSTP